MYWTHDHGFVPLRVQQNTNPLNTTTLNTIPIGITTTLNTMTIGINIAKFLRQVDMPV